MHNVIVDSNYSNYMKRWFEFDAHLSLGSFFPLLRILSEAFVPPPCRAAATLASKSETTASMASAFARNSGEVVERREGRTLAWYNRRRAPPTAARLGRRERWSARCIEIGTTYRSSSNEYGNV